MDPKFVVCIFTCGRDELCLIQTLKHLHQHHSEVAVCIFDDHLNPLSGKIEMPNVWLQQQTAFDRQRNLNGRECVKGMIECFNLASRLTGAEWVVKLDSDTLFINPDRALEMADEYFGVGGGNNPVNGFWGPCYLLRSNVLRDMQEAVDTVPDLPAPEDQAMWRIVSKVTGGKVKMYTWGERFLNGYILERTYCASRYLLPVALTFGSGKGNIVGKTSEEIHQWIADEMRWFVDQLELGDSLQHPNGGKPLLDDQAWAPLLSQLRGKRVAVYQAPGNVGDLLIHAGMKALFDRHGIEHVMVREDDLHKLDDEQPDVICWGGGGNLGGRWHFAREWEFVADIADKKRVPLVVLPHTLECAFPGLKRAAKVYAREKTTLGIVANEGIKTDLVPDLALAHPRIELGPPEEGEGVYIRADIERSATIDENLRKRSIGDPVRLCITPMSYIATAGKHEHVVTDRLHFAIAALLAGRTFTLLDGAYHKQRAMRETWLDDLTR